MTTTHAPLTLATRLTISDDVLAQEVGDEVVLLDLAGERYFGLDPVGTRIWALLPDAASLGAVLDNLCAEFDAPRERIEVTTDVLKLTIGEQGIDFRDQFLGTITLHCDGFHHRQTQFARQRGDIDFNPAARCRIDLIERNQHRPAQRFELKHEAQVQAQVGCIDHTDQ